MGSRGPTHRCAPCLSPTLGGLFQDLGRNLTLDTNPCLVPSLLNEREQFSSHDGSWEGKPALMCLDGPGSREGVLGSDHWALRSLRWKLVPAALAEVEKD